MHDVVIIGTSGLAQLAHDILVRHERLRPLAFVADNEESTETASIAGLPVLRGGSPLGVVVQRGVRRAIVALEENSRRVELATELLQRGFILASAIHPLARIAPSARLGRHLIVGPKAIICVHASIDDHCVISTGAIVEHDNRLGAGVCLEPAARLAGGVQVDSLASIGIGGSVIPYLRIGRAARVAAGAVVIRDVPPGAVVSGVPARGVGVEASRFVPDRAARARPTVEIQPI